MKSDVEREREVRRLEERVVCRVTSDRRAIHGAEGPTDRARGTGLQDVLRGGLRSGLQAPLAAALVLLVAVPAFGRAEEADAAVPEGLPSALDPDLRPRLAMDIPFHGVVTGGALAVSGLSLLFPSELAPIACRWCAPNRFDLWARRELRWTPGSVAGTASNVLVVVLPVGAAITLGLSAGAQGAEGREVAEDFLVVTEAAAVTALLTQGSKFGFARLRPDAWAAGTSTTADSRMSFVGGHSSFAFSIAAAATQVARLRDRPGWRWLALAAFTGAAATGYLRVAADRHWATDVIAGAGLGTAVGLSVPLLAFHPDGERRPAVTLVPAPGGLGLLF
jgi:membrane-associated phospholipid phosphatase